MNVASQTQQIETVSSKRIKTILQVLLGSLFIGLCAQIKIPLWFTPVPFTGQVFGVLLVGALLGSRKGALAALLYLVEGSLGLPVWAGGCSGFLHLLGPTGGYRFAYVLQAFLAGLYVEKAARFSFFKTAAAFSVCCVLQLGIGTLWLARFVDNPLALGFLPFVPIDMAKAVMVTAVLKIRKKA